jgi:activator of 2-hydroxyglutaryl-CoA dehydratase
MIVAGCDVGSLTAKVVIMDEGKIISSSVILSKANPAESADEVMNTALTQALL